MLEASLDDVKFIPVFEKAIEEISNKLKKKYGSDIRFSDWLNNLENQSGSAREKAVRWRELEILIERRISETQLSLPSHLP